MSCVGPPQPGPFPLRLDPHKLRSLPVHLERCRVHCVCWMGGKHRGPVREGASVGGAGAGQENFTLKTHVLGRTHTSGSLGLAVKLRKRPRGAAPGPGGPAQHRG